MKFRLVKRESVWVVVWVDGGCRPATSVEIELWLARPKKKDSWPAPRTEF